MAQTSVSQMVQQLEQGTEQLLERYNAIVAERDALQSIITNMTQARQSPAPEHILNTLERIQATRRPEIETVEVKPQARKAKKVRAKAKKKRKTKAVATEARRKA